jgi:hypothetical protein
MTHNSFELTFISSSTKVIQKLEKGVNYFFLTKNYRFDYTSLFATANRLNKKIQCKRVSILETGGSLVDMIQVSLKNDNE